jgi:hypothetical protein
MVSLCLHAQLDMYSQSYSFLLRLVTCHETPYLFIASHTLILFKESKAFSKSKNNRQRSVRYPCSVLWLYFFRLSPFILLGPHVRWAPCHHDMAHNQDPDGEDSLQLSVNWISSRRQLSSSGPPAWKLGMGLTTFHCKNKSVTKIYNEPWIWADFQITYDKNE